MHDIGRHFLTLKSPQASLRVRLVFCSEMLFHREEELEIKSLNCSKGEKERASRV